MSFKSAVFALAFAAVGLASLDAKAAINEVTFTLGGAPPINLLDQAADDEPDENPTIVATVPEFSSWAMMLAGFAVLGLAGYRRRKAAPIAA